MNRARTNLFLVAISGVLILCGPAWAVDTNGLVAHWMFDEGSGTIAYDSAGSNDGTIYGAQWAAGILDGALDFDGVDDYVDCGSDPSLYGMAEITISAWIKPRTAGEAGYGRIVANDKDTKSYAFYMYNGNNVRLDLHLNGGLTSVYGTDSAVTYDAWHHVVGTFDGNEIKIYVDETVKA